MAPERVRCRSSTCATTRTYAKSRADQLLAKNIERTTRNISYGERRLEVTMRRVFGEIEALAVPELDDDNRSIDRD
jgi:hypothetical protein